MLPILISSTLVFAAVFLAVRSGGDVWDQVTARYVADITPKLDSLSLDHSQLAQILAHLGHLAGGRVCVRGFHACACRPWQSPRCIWYMWPPRIILDFMIRRRRALLRDQMVAATIALANTSRAGLSLAQGIETSAKKRPNR